MEKVKELHDKEPLISQRRHLEGLTKKARNVEIILRMKSLNLSYCYCRQSGRVRESLLAKMMQGEILY